MSDTESYYSDQESLSLSLSKETHSSIKTKNVSHNFKCAKCTKTFFLCKEQKMIRCANCGYRILLKLRTTNYIVYKTQ